MGNVVAVLNLHTSAVYLFRVYYENSTKTVDYDTGSILRHLMFSGIYNAGQNYDLCCNTFILPLNFDE